MQQRNGSHRLCSMSCGAVHIPRLPLRPFQTRRCANITRGSQQQQPDAGAWWDKLNKKSIKGPSPPAVDPVPTTTQGWNERRMGVKGYRDFENLKRNERQRVWDAMRRVARQRYERGDMPEWFKPAWLDMEEAPTNTFWRAHGLSYYQQDSQWLGDNAPSTSSGGGDNGDSGSGDKGGGGGGGGWFWWWREEDPYWPLRDWGDHPMRWWTLGFAAVLATGGLLAFASHGSTEAAQVGLGCGAVLAMCGAAMSDMQHGELGEVAVKAAWATCLLLAAREYWWGWRHKRGRRVRQPHLEGCGLTSAAMCLLYMWTGMSGLARYALPTNPGEAFKMVDIAQKHKVWEAWGYGDEQMR